MEIHIVKSTPEHIISLKNSLRKGDEQEIINAGLTVKKALWRTYRVALSCKTVLVDGEVAAIFGVAGSFLGQTGQPFLLTGTVCERVSPLRFARIYQQEVQKLLTEFPHLANFVDATYTKAVRLMENIGFTVSDPEPFGRNGAMFRKFEMRA